MHTCMYMYVFLCFYINLYLIRCIDSEMLILDVSCVLYIIIGRSIITGRWGGGGQRGPCPTPTCIYKKKLLKAAPKKEKFKDWKIKRLLTTASWGTILWNLVLKMLVLHHRASRIQTKYQGPLIEAPEKTTTFHKRSNCWVPLHIMDPYSIALNKNLKIPFIQINKQQWNKTYYFCNYLLIIRWKNIDQ